MDNTSLNQKSLVWKIPKGFLIHIAGLPYETVEETEVNGFARPEFKIGKAPKNGASTDIANQTSSAAPYEKACCELSLGSNGRYYIEASTSDGEAMLRKMLVEGIAVAVTPSKPQAPTGVAGAMG